MLQLPSQSLLRLHSPVPWRARSTYLRSPDSQTRSQGAPAWTLTSCGRQTWRHWQALLLLLRSWRVVLPLLHPRLSRRTLRPHVLLTSERPWGLLSRRRRPPRRRGSLTQLPTSRNRAPWPMIVVNTRWRSRALPIPTFLSTLWPLRKRRLRWCHRTCISTLGTHARIDVRSLLLRLQGPSHWRWLLQLLLGLRLLSPGSTQHSILLLFVKPFEFRR